MKSWPRNEASREGICDTVRTIFQPSASASDIPVTSKGIYLFLKLRALRSYLVDFFLISLHGIVNQLLISLSLTYVFHNQFKVQLECLLVSWFSFCQNKILRQSISNQAASDFVLCDQFYSVRTHRNYNQWVISDTIEIPDWIGLFDFQMNNTIQRSTYCMCFYLIILYASTLYVEELLWSD